MNAFAHTVSLRRPRAVIDQVLQVGAREVQNRKLADSRERPRKKAQISQITEQSRSVTRIITTNKIMMPAM